MQDASSPGHAQPNIKTINVEANLLREWLDDRARARDRSARLAMIIAFVLLLSVVALPPLFELSTRVATNAETERLKMLGLAATRNGLEAQRTAASPRIAGKEMEQLTRKQSELFLGNLLLAINAANGDMALSSIHAEVLGGTMSISSKADATGFPAARQYVEKASDGPDVRSALLLSTRSSDVLGPSGIAFEFVKKVQVGQ